MDVTHDWQSFQNVFYPRRKLAVLPPAAGASVPLYLVVEAARVITAYGEGEDLNDWVGRPFSEVAEKMAHRKLVVFDRKQVDEWLTTATTLPHFYDQSAFLRTKTGMPLHRHFLLEAIHGWIRKLIPTSYGIYIKLEGSPTDPAIREGTKEFFMVVRRGRVESYTGIDAGESGKTPAEVVRSLSERHILKVQGFVVNQKDWAEWSEMGFPWRKIAAALRSKALRVVPFRWGVAGLLALRGMLGI